MKRQSKVTYEMKGKVFGGAEMMQCIPIVSRTLEELKNDIAEVSSHEPDVIEWRIDYYEGIGDTEKLKEAAEAVRPYVQSIPLLLTPRDKSEGGIADLAPETRLNAIKVCCEAGLPDIVDVENSMSTEFIAEVSKFVKASGAKLVLSYHDFSKTPDEEALMQKLKACVANGADIAKMSVMANTFDDVVKVANVSARSKNGEVEVPVITIAMGSIGGITRVLGPEMGTDLTFVCSANASGPGQVNIEDFRKFRKSLNL